MTSYQFGHVNLLTPLAIFAARGDFQPEFLFEYSRAGIIIPSANIQGITLDVYDSVFQMTSLSLEIVTCVFCFGWIGLKLLDFLEVKKTSSRTLDAYVQFFTAPMIMDWTLVFSIFGGRITQLMYATNTRRTLIYQTEGPPLVYSDWQLLISMYEALCTSSLTQLAHSTVPS